MGSIVRRDFLSAACAGAIAHLLGARVSAAEAAMDVSLTHTAMTHTAMGPSFSSRARTKYEQALPHPAPRRGITAAKLPPRAELADVPDVSAVFDLVREIPGVLDGIRCNCSCAGSTGYRSLLSCYERPDVMAKTCDVCKAQTRLAHRMHKSGKSLNEIRKGIDARFGG